MTCHCQEKKEKSNSDELPDILDLFPKYSNGADGRRANNEFLVNLDTLDEKRLLQNVEKLKKELQLMGLNSTTTAITNETSLSPERRLLGYLTLDFGPRVRTPSTSGATRLWNKHKSVHTHIYSTKIADLMIQFIYMARHKLMELDSHTIVKPKPENYRQVFLYKHLVRLSDKLWDVHQIIRNKTRLVHSAGPDHKWVYHILKNTIKLHQRAVKLYVDFSYFWWVFVRTQERFMERTHVVITRPPSTDFTFRTRVSVPPGDMANSDYPTPFAEYGTPSDFWEIFGTPTTTKRAGK